LKRFRNSLTAIAKIRKLAAGFGHSFAPIITSSGRPLGSATEIALALNL
jgi:hypothetical protein